MPYQSLHRGQKVLGQGKVPEVIGACSSSAVLSNSWMSVRLKRAACEDLGDAWQQALVRGNEGIHLQGDVCGMQIPVVV